MIGVSLFLLLLMVLVYGESTGTILHGLALRSPLLLTGSADLSSFGGGFSANVIISLWAMLIVGVCGVVLGIGLISSNPAMRLPSSFLMNVLRNSPWLVILYAMLYLLPFEVTLFGTTYFISPTMKAIVGLSLPVTANMAEVFRGGVEAIPTGQWESARALGYRRLQILRHVVVPQAIPLMIPNIMTTYATLFIGTSLVVVTGTEDVLSLARVVIASDGDQFATGIYIYVLFLFFIFAFPIAVLTRWLERRIRRST